MKKILSVLTAWWYPAKPICLKIQLWSDLKTKLTTQLPNSDAGMVAALTERPFFSYVHNHRGLPTEPAFPSRASTYLK